MTEASRQKKEQWLRDVDRVRGCETRTLIAREMDRHGLDWLTDEQVDDLVGRAASKLRFQNRLNIQNRRLYAAQKAESAA